MLKNRMHYLLFLFYFIFTGSLYAAQYDIDNVHSFVNFKIRHLNIGYVTGRFNNFKGTINFDMNKLQSSSVSANITSGSIDSTITDRDSDLKSPTFLDTAKYPEITFVSKKIIKLNNNKFKIIGDLKIKNVTKEIKLDAKYLGNAIDQFNNDKIAFRASTRINRFDYGVSFDGKLKNGYPMIGKTVYITLFIEAIKQKKEGAKWKSVLML